MQIGQHAVHGNSCFHRRFGLHCMSAYKDAAPGRGERPPHQQRIRKPRRDESWTPQEYAAKLNPHSRAGGRDQKPRPEGPQAEPAMEEPHDISQLDDVPKKSRFVQSVQQQRAAKPQRQSFDAPSNQRRPPENASASRNRGPVEKFNTTPAHGHKWQSNMNPNSDFSSPEARTASRKKQTPPTSSELQDSRASSRAPRQDAQNRPKKQADRDTGRERGWSRVNRGEKTWSGFPDSRQARSDSRGPPPQQGRQVSDQDFSPEPQRQRPGNSGRDSASSFQPRREPSQRSDRTDSRPGWNARESFRSREDSPPRTSQRRFPANSSQRQPRARPEFEEVEGLDFSFAPDPKSRSGRGRAEVPWEAAELTRSDYDRPAAQRSPRHRQDAAPGAAGGRRPAAGKGPSGLDTKLLARLEEGSRAADHNLEEWEANQEAAQVDLPMPVVREQTGSTATFFTNESFEDLGLSKRMRSSLQAIGVTRPSHIQAAAIKALKGEIHHAVLADHSGSGKTLAYLIPVIEHLKQLEKERGEQVRDAAAPSIVIVLPTTELCLQVYEVARALSKAGCNFRSMAATGGHKKKVQKDNLSQSVNVVIGTPGRLLTLMRAGDLSLEKCLHFIIDEVDVLSENYAGSEMLAFQQAAPASTKFLLVTASLPEPTWMELQSQFPGVTPVIGPALHRPAPGSLEQLIDCSGGDVVNEETGYVRKFAGLVSVLKERRVPKTIIFCNKITTCRKVENSIARTKELNGFTILPHHAAIDEAERIKHLKRLLGQSTKYAEKDLDEQLVFLTTDRASRGLDTNLVDHVVLFDFPRSPSEYVRRAGRTARGAGSKGIVSLIVIGRQVGLARKILDRNEKGVPLHKVPIG